MKHLDVYCIAGFVAPFSEGRRGGAAAGRDLAAVIARCFESAGFHPGPPVDLQYAWELSPTVGSFPVRTLIGHVGDMDSDPPRQWLVTNDLQLTPLDRLFRPARVKAKAEALRTLSGVLHTMFSADERFSFVRWYNPNTFDLPGDEPRDHP